jgi:hypothetical protein
MGKSTNLDGELTLQTKIKFKRYIQGGSNMTGTDCV